MRLRSDNAEPSAEFRKKSQLEDRTTLPCSFETHRDAIPHAVCHGFGRSFPFNHSMNLEPGIAKIPANSAVAEANAGICRSSAMLDVLRGVFLIFRME